MAQGDVRNSRRFRELAAQLREQAELHYVSLAGGEAEELLGARLSAVAGELRVTERTALTSYISEHTIEVLAANFASSKAEYRRTTEEAEPVTLEAAEAGHVIAALGMALKLAVEHVEETRTASLGLITDAADAIVRLGTQCGPSPRSNRSDSVATNWCWRAAFWSAPLSVCAQGSGDAPAARTPTRRSAA